MTDPNDKKPRVVILGGGVAGLSAAHELLRRGFAVAVYERWAVPGGKARSFEYHAPGTSWPRGLPAEHGFRFFPGFYRHLPDTMREIPTLDGRGSVFQHLVPATRIGLASYTLPFLEFPAGLPRSTKDLLVSLRALFESRQIKFAPGELEFYADRIWQVLTSCQARRLSEYEKLGWWEFIGAGARRSENYNRYLGNLSRSLVAADPKRASTKTNGDILVQLLLDMGRLGVHVDRVLDGPTNEVWIYPWIKYLLGLGLEYHINATVDALHCQDGKLHAAIINDMHDKVPMQRVLDCDRYGMTLGPPQGGRIEVSADYFIAAMPVERIAPLLTDDIFELDPTLRNILGLSQHVQWMNGLMFYLGRDVPILHGHTIYVDPPWALTSISQKQFWPAVNLSDYGDGSVAGILSVDISNWLESSDGEPAASDCTREQVIERVWQELKRSLNRDHDERLSDANRRYAMLDPAIVPLLQDTALRTETKHARRLENLEPLLVNEVNTWSLRPEAFTRIPNLFLASDYVRTNTDLATMEGANEAARRAVNALLDRCGVRAPKCPVYALQEPVVLRIYRWLDKRRYRLGLPWRKHMPWLAVVLSIIWYWLVRAGVQGKAALRR